MLNSVSTSALVAIYNNAIEDNKLLGPRRVSKFKDKATAVARVQHLIDTYGLEVVTNDGGEPTKLAKSDDGDSVEHGGSDATTESGVDTNTDATGTAGDTIEHGADTGSTATETAETGATETGATETAGTEPSAPAAKPEKRKITRDPNAPRRTRQGSVSREPRAAADIGECRENSNQALLVDVLFAGTTIEAATRHVNGLLGKELSTNVIYSTILYDVCTLKGYGVRVEHLNGEKLHEIGLYADAAELKFGKDGYDPAVTRNVYFLRLPKGMNEPKPHKAKAEPKPPAEKKPKAEKPAGEKKPRGKKKDETPAAEPAAEPAAPETGPSDAAPESGPTAAE